MAIKPKKWLIENGHMSADKINQRGRLSKENVALIKAAVASGVDIEGYDSVKPKATDKPTGPVESETPVTVERVKVNPNAITDIGEPVRPESSWSAYAYVDGKKRVIGMRTVDNGCGNSLTYCVCRAPVVNVDQTTALVSFATV